MSNIPLVSVLTPCYNGEKHIDRLLNSILNQTYTNIEFIIVNDGSTDASEDIILSYKDKFEEKGYIFKYIKQVNKGLGGAINTGLKVFTGDYLCWPDADDYLELDSIEKRVEILQENLEYAIVTSNAYVRNASDLNSYRLLVNDGNRKYVEDKDAFSNLLYGRGVFCPGCHMVRTAMFLDVNPEREIYEARRGQNWQMLLPIFYKYKRLFLDIPLYNYIDNPGSMSKDQNNLDSLLFRMNEHEDIILNTLLMIERIQNVDLKTTKEEIKKEYIERKLELAIEFGDRIVYSNLLDAKKHYSKKTIEKMFFIISKRNLLFQGYRFLKVCIRKFNR